MQRTLASLLIGLGFVVSCGGRTSLDFDDYDDDRSGAPGVGGANPGKGGARMRGGARTRGGSPSTSGGQPSSSGGATYGGATAGGAISVDGGQGFGGRGGGGRNAGGRAGGGRSGGGRSGAGGQLAAGGGIIVGGGVSFGGATPTFGGFTSGGQMGAGGSMPCRPLAPNEELIDDMNDGDRFIPPISGRSGAWYTAHDPTPNVGMYPSPAGPFVMTQASDACFTNQVYVKGGPFALWGAVFGFGVGSPYNALRYRGLSFWARSSAGSGGLRVSFPDAFTHQNGGICDPATPGPTYCYDHHGKRIFLSNTWTKVVVLFSEARQEGWGYQAGFTPGALYEVIFQIPANSTFAFEVDDVAFIF